MVPRLRVDSLNLFFFCPESLGIDGIKENSCSMMLSMLDSSRILAVLTAVLGRQAVIVSQIPDHSSYAGYTAARLNKSE